MTESNEYRSVKNFVLEYADSFSLSHTLKEIKSIDNNKQMGPPEKKLRKKLVIQGIPE